MSDRTPNQIKTYALNDAGPGWDDRKAILDVFYDNGGTLVGDLDRYYTALLAVARYGAETMYDYLIPEMNDGTDCHCTTINGVKRCQIKEN